MKQFPLFMFLLGCSVIAQVKQEQDFCKEAFAKGKQELVGQVYTQFTVQRCCKSALGECLEKKPDCRLGQSMGDFVCWLASYDQSFDKIMEECRKRYDSYVATATFEIKAGLFESIGNENAPVSVYIYISGSCPLCKAVCSDLHREVARGMLKNKVRVVPKLMTTGIADYALLAANAQGSFWPFILEMNLMKQRPTEELMIQLAGKVMLDVTQFKNDLKNKKLHDRAAASRAEALGNDVAVTPTLFLNKKRYRSYKNWYWILDAINYEYQHASSGKK
ncbi:MAG: thioredoxin domain-containing protein [Chitinivibrionales bacterium]|nr:thioredoxin domain-containing protein [Chitinivibrionales bacterium]